MFLGLLPPELTMNPHRTQKREISFHGVPVRTETKSRQVLLDLGIQPAGLGLLIAPLGGQAGHLLVEWLTIIRLGLGAYVAAGGQYVAVLAALFERRALAEAGNVSVALTLTLFREERGIGRLSSPGVVGVGDAGDVFV